jgi:hypothetical protein
MKGGGGGSDIEAADELHFLTIFSSHIFLVMFFSLIPGAGGVTKIMFKFYRIFQSKFCSIFFLPFFFTRVYQSILFSLILVIY